MSERTGLRSSQRLGNTPPAPSLLQQVGSVFSSHGNSVNAELDDVSDDENSEEASTGTVEEVTSENQHPSGQQVAHTAPSSVYFTTATAP